MSLNQRAWESHLHFTVEVVSGNGTVQEKKCFENVQEKPRDPSFLAQIRRESVYCSSSLGFPGGASGKEPACQCTRYNVTWVQYLGREDPLEEGMAIHSSILAWRSPWTEEPR